MEILEVLKMRKEIEKFAVAMEAKMAEKDAEYIDAELKPDNWKQTDQEYLTERLLDEVIEYCFASGMPQFSEKGNLMAHIVCKINTKLRDTEADEKAELIDIANFCMMIRDNLESDDADMYSIIREGEDERYMVLCAEHLGATKIEDGHKAVAYDGDEPCTFCEMDGNKDEGTGG